MSSITNSDLATFQITEILKKLEQEEEEKG
jgi:hypothetical protein